MRVDKENKLKALLKQAGTEKPAEGFTDSVMQMIGFDAALEAALKSVLKQHPAEGTSFDFTASVMRAIAAQRKPVIIQPIITKKAWYIIAGVASLFVLIAFAMSLKPADVELVNSSRITSIINKMQVIPGTVVLALVAITILLLGDYLLNGRRKAELN